MLVPPTRRPFLESILVILPIVGAIRERPPQMNSKTRKVNVVSSQPKHLLAWGRGLSSTPLGLPFPF